MEVFMNDLGETPVRVLTRLLDDTGHTHETVVAKSRLLTIQTILAIQEPV
jgi:hypothetical protein